MSKIVTRVSTQKNKERFNIDLDGEFAFGVGVDTLTRFNLFKGTEVSDLDIEEIKNFDAEDRLRVKAIDYIAVQPRSDKEVFDRLMKLDDVNSEQVRKVITNLNESGYLNDADYAKLFVSNQINITSDGPISIKQKLMKKGVSQSNIETSLLVFDDDLQREKIDKLTEKYLNVNQKKYSLNQLKNKLYSNLASKGFKSSLISEKLSNLDIENDDENQINLIKKQINKVEKRFEKYGNQKNFKIKMFLYSKGFSSELINQAMEDNDV
jgi:regulatory protein